MRALFRRSRIIGRRFRLVHVMCGAETVEVSTFRGPNAVGEGEDRGVDEHGRILRDNVFGTQEQDATRRDFTINALFYDPASQEIWDYHGGVADLKQAQAAHDRRCRAALPRGPDPHAARGAVRREPRPRDRRAHARADHGASRGCSRTCRRRGCSTRC